MKPTVYLVHYYCRPGGIELLMPTIIKEITDYNVKVFVIRPCKDKNLSVYKNIQVEVEYGSEITLIALTKFLFFVLKDRKGIYHLFNTGPYFLFVLRLLSVKRIVYAIRGSIYWKTKFQKLVRKFLWQLAISPKVIFTANSNYSNDVFCELVSKKAKPITLYNPINLEKFNSRNGNDTNDVNKIIYVGRLFRGKNLEKWIDTAAFLIGKGVNKKFEIYGVGPQEAMVKERIEALGLADKIIMRGHEKKIEEVYKDADLFIFLSEHESFGNVVIESILCGTPVVAFNIPSMREIFKEYPDFLIENNDQYLDKIFEKVKIIPQLKTLAAKASLDFSKRYNSETHITKLKSIYNEFA